MIKIKERANSLLRKVYLVYNKIIYCSRTNRVKFVQNKIDKNSDLFDCLLIVRVEVKDQCSVKPKTGDQDDQLWLSLDSMIIMIPMITMVIIFILMIMIKMIMMI